MSVSTKRLTREEVSDFIKENGCELLEKEYINNRQKLLIKCKCGNEFKTSFKEFKGMNKRQCNECGKKIAREKLQQVTYKNYKKSTYETIKNRFKEYGHIMVWNEEEFNEKYKNYKTLVKLRCECGNYYYKNIADIKKCVHNKCDVCRSKLKNKDRLKYTSENVQKIIESVETSDLVIAPIADNRMFEIIDQFINEELTDKQCQHALSATQLGYQHVFRTQKALEQIQLLERCYLCSSEKAYYNRSNERESNTSLNKSVLAKKLYSTEGKYISELLS